MEERVKKEILRIQFGHPYSPLLPSVCEKIVTDRNAATQSPWAWASQMLKNKERLMSAMLKGQRGSDRVWVKCY